MGVKDKLKQLGKIRVDFWNEGQKQTVTVDLPEPKRERPIIAPEAMAASPIAPAVVEAPPTYEPSPAAARLRKVLDDLTEPSKGSLAEAEKRADAYIARQSKKSIYSPPISFDQPKPKYETVPHVPQPPSRRVTAPTARSFRVEKMKCPLCGLTVDAWRTYADGAVRCLPCSSKRGLHAV